MTRYTHLGQPIDLERAIDNLQKAVDGSHRNASDLASRLASFGDALRLRYQATRLPADLESAVEKFELSVARTRRGTRQLPSHLISLGTGLIDRFERTGSVADLKLAITHFRRAIDDAGPSDPDFPMYLSNLGTALSKLFGREPNTGHLNEAIEVLGRAVDMTKRSGARVANFPGYLNNLASALAIRHELSGARADLERSIEASSEVIAAIDPRAPMRPSFLANLGSRTNAPAHLDAAIECWEEALRVLHASYATAPVALKMGGQRTWPALYTNLASAYLGRMEADPHNAAANLQRAIEVSEQSKSYILAEQFSRAEMPAPPGISTDRSRREHSLLAELSRLDSTELGTYGEQAAPQLQSAVLGALERRERSSSGARSRHRDRRERITCHCVPPTRQSSTSLRGLLPSSAPKRPCFPSLAGR
jgi:tetratricopeptide (TPR) repeat protein